MLTGGEIRRAKAVFLATGKHDLGGYRRPPGKQNDLIAFKMYFRISPAQQQALRGWVDLIIFPGGYAGMQLTEDGDANLCLLVNRKTLQNRRNELDCASRENAGFFRSPCPSPRGCRGRCSRSPLRFHRFHMDCWSIISPPDVWRLGDQSAVIPSFSGDGMSIALHSAHDCGRDVHE